MIGDIHHADEVLLATVYKGLVPWPHSKELTSSWSSHLINFQTAPEMRPKHRRQDHPAGTCRTAHWITMKPAVVTMVTLELSPLSCDTKCPPPGCEPPQRRIFVGKPTKSFGTTTFYGQTHGVPGDARPCGAPQKHDESSALGRWVIRPPKQLGHSLQH